MLIENPVLKNRFILAQASGRFYRDFCKFIVTAYIDPFLDLTP
ncbi:hypothetical protein MHH_c20940 [Mannheimia haemolytica M42548]|nr:hypothetical protein MHH_c20940 [Mannheimia haemolytica M42548]